MANGYAKYSIFGIKETNKNGKPSDGSIQILPPIPKSCQVLDENGRISPEWQRWFFDLTELRVLPSPQLLNISQSTISPGVGIMALKEGIADPLPIATKTQIYIDVNGQLCLMDSTGYKVAITRGDGWHVDGTGTVGTTCDLFSFKEQSEEPWSVNGFSQLYSAEDEYFSMEDSAGTRWKIATSSVPQVTGVSQPGVRPGFALKEKSADPKPIPNYSQLYVDVFSFLCIMDSTGYKCQIVVSS